MEKLPNLIETLSFLKFPDEKHLLHFSDDSLSDSDSESTIKLPKKTLPSLDDVFVKGSHKSSDKLTDIENIEDNKDDLLLSCTFNNIFTETLTEKYKSPSKTMKSKKKSSLKSKKSSMKSKKKSSLKSKKSSLKSKKVSMKSKESSMKSKMKSKKSSMKSFI